MKVLILALDGLDYRYVERWRLRNLLQRTHGTYSVGEFRQAKNLSLSVWASFITGKIHRFGNWWDKPTLIKIADKIPISDRWKWRFAKLLGARIIDKRFLKAPSMFDQIEGAVAVNVPVYNEQTRYHVRKLDALHFHGVEAYKQAVKENHVDREIETFKAIRKGGWRLLMSWFDIADSLGHVTPLDSQEMKWVYEYLDGMVETMKRQAGGQVLCLVVSDHGMEWRDGFGEHTRTAFWSLSHETDWKPRRVTDFYPKIMEWLRGERKCMRESRILPL